ncbi:3',5'-cyclic-nucleotide phosphodiesterase [Methylobacillus caricis]|uniref:MBL fold metallo-hydrolase n=1 Tax=Methylobacillus caricis TaxID=1971611 RepID=UPI001CFFE582|nr:3',5'-cyclic-nucleotide phosphodiesterase [Methylobacillus caricis]MCB5188452.1 3',5'-cyclic-nucleotide phosphodiesterase [Methylobacillus caricis]
MKVTVLGCSGGIGQGLQTTSLLLDDDILIDAGTGVGDLSLEALAAINHVFLTHSHLDHIACLPFLLDSVMSRRSAPVTVHALPETIEVLKTHVFNWHIWPDFNQIPHQEHPFLQYQPLSPGKALGLNGRVITALPANHSVPAVGYLLDNGVQSIAFSGDTTSCDAFWQQVNQVGNLACLIIETSFSNAEIELAWVSRHLCPSLLLEGLDQLHGRPQVYITHLKPGEGDIIMQEIAACHHPLNPARLQQGQVIHL